MKNEKFVITTIRIKDEKDKNRVVGEHKALAVSTEAHEAVKRTAIFVGCFCDNYIIEVEKESFEKEK